MRPPIIRSAAPVVALHLLIAWASAGAAPNAATIAAPMPDADDMPMTDYLGLLAQIAPAALDGSKAYLQAFQQRCGRPMQTPELRWAMSNGHGDPLLMAMIRASHLRDRTTMNLVGRQITCERWATR